jgi:hypothetical protein
MLKRDAGRRAPLFANSISSSVGVKSSANTSAVPVMRNSPLRRAAKDLALVAGSTLRAAALVRLSW